MSRSSRYRSPSRPADQSRPHPRLPHLLSDPSASQPPSINPRLTLLRQSVAAGRDEQAHFHGMMRTRLLAVGGVLAVVVGAALAVAKYGQELPAKPAPVASNRPSVVTVKSAATDLAAWGVPPVSCEGKCRPVQPISQMRFDWP